MSKHTPGPWMVSPIDGLTIGHLTEENPQDLSIPGFRAVAVVKQRDPEETMANSNLLIVAPDLLEACKKAHDGLDAAFSEDGTTDADTLRKVLDRVGRARARLSATLAKMEE